MTWTDPKTFAVGEKVTASHWNTYVKDNQKAATEWETYTPEWTATTTDPDLGNGTLSGSYTQAGDLVHFALFLEVGSTTTFGSGNYRFSLPVAAANANHFCSLVNVRDDSTTLQNIGTANIQGTSSTVGIIVSGSGWTAPTVPWVWAADDTIRISGTYESA